MKLMIAPFLTGIAFAVLKWKRLIIINTWWIVLCFVISFLMLYISIHKKNKEKRIPQAVYLTRG